MPKHEFVVADSDQGKRLDVYLALVLADRFSRSQLKKLIEDGLVKVDAHEVPAHYRVHGGNAVHIEWGDRDPEETRAENIPLNIVFEDEDILLVNKPAGMVVHPAHGNPHHTLVNALLYHVKGLSSLGGAVRPGIVHRLDKDTSGIMVVAKNDKAHALLASQFKKQTLKRIYNVIVRDIVQHDEGIIEEPVGRAFLNRKKIIVKPSGGKDAVTFYRVLRRFRKATLLELRLQTGRTHQIRVHMNYMNHPVLGDALYGMPHPGISRQAVHALALGLIHPRTDQEKFFQTELPEDMKSLISFLEKE